MLQVYTHTYTETYSHAVSSITNSKPGTFLYPGNMSIFALKGKSHCIPVYLRLVICSGFIKQFLKFSLHFYSVPFMFPVLFSLKIPDLKDSIDDRCLVVYKNLDHHTKLTGLHFNQDSNHDTVNVHFMP